MEIFQKKGGGEEGEVLTRKRSEKIDVRVVTLEETMGEITVTDYIVKKVESLVKLLWYNICFVIKIIM